MTALTAETHGRREIFASSRTPLLRVLPLFLCVSAAISGCIEHRIKADPVEIKPIKVEPIHITVDVNVRVQERLKEFFAFQEEQPKTQEPPANQQPR